MDESNPATTSAAGASATSRASAARRTGPTSTCGLARSGCARPARSARVGASERGVEPGKDFPLVACVAADPGEGVAEDLAAGVGDGFERGQWEPGQVG